MLMKNTVQLVQQVHIHINFMQQQRTGYVFHRTLVYLEFRAVKTQPPFIEVKVAISHRDVFHSLS